MVSLSATNLTVRAGTKLLVDDASLSVSTGELVALIGPNGAGKSSLIKCLMGMEQPASGDVTLDGQAINRLPHQRRAQLLSYLPQTRPLAWPLTVRDVVSLGRFAYGSVPGRLSAQDTAAVDDALAAVEALHQADRRTDTLSGGELARVHLARCFVGHTPLLIADEPLAALDPLHQWQVMELFKAYVARGNGALVVIHDLNLAHRFADRHIWMQHGRIVADGPPRETMTAERLADVYGVDATVDASGVTIKGARPEISP